MLNIREEHQVGFQAVCSLLLPERSLKSHLKRLNIRLHKIYFGGSGVVTCGRTDKHDEVNGKCFQLFVAKDPKRQAGTDTRRKLTVRSYNMQS